jgi:uncharacterized membrane protein YagU involved in acid resistance
LNVLNVRFRPIADVPCSAFSFMINGSRRFDLPDQETGNQQNGKALPWCIHGRHAMQEVLEHREQQERSSVLATALAGAAAGAVGTAALDSVDWFLWDREAPSSKRQTEEVRPGGEPPADVLVGRIEEAADAETSERTHHRRGVAMHLAIGIAPAVGYALAREKLPVKGVTGGALFGLGLWLLQDEVLNSVTGLGAKPQDYPWQAHARGLAAHLVYGIATELALGVADRTHK